MGIVISQYKDAYEPISIMESQKAFDPCSPASGWLCSAGKHETCAITDFKYGVANRGASIRIPRDTEKSGKGGGRTLAGSFHLVSV